MLRKLLMFQNHSNGRFPLKVFRYQKYRKSIVFYQSSQNIKTSTKMMSVEKRHFDNPFPEFVPHKENHLVDLQTKKVGNMYLII